MSSIRKTKKKIKKHPSGTLWVKHAKFWMLYCVNRSNEYRSIAWFFYMFDIKELVKITGISKQSLMKYIQQ